MNNTPDYNDNLYFEKLQKTENVAKNVENENSQDLTEQWLQKQLPEDEYYVELNDGTYDYLIYTKDDEPEIDREIMEIKRVIAPVPSYEKWKALNGNMDSVMQTNQALAQKLKDLEQRNENNIWLYQDIIRRRDNQIAELDANQDYLSGLIYECQRFLTENMAKNKEAAELADKINKTLRSIEYNEV